jgi:phosphatidylinositol alpha-mannosyltransferase
MESEGVKVVQICPYDYDRYGGVQRHVRSLVNELALRGHEILVIAPGPAIPDPAAHTLYTGSRKSISMHGTRFELSWVSRRELDSLERHLNAWGAEVMHYHTMWVPLMPLEVFRRVRLPSVATFHNTPPGDLSGRMLSSVLRGASRWLCGRLDAAIAVSHSALQQLSPGPRGVQPVVLPPAVDLSAFRALAKTAHDSRRPFFHVLFIGRLEPRKGALTLLEAWKRIILGMENWPLARLPRLTIVGSGALEPAVGETQKVVGADAITHIAAPNAEQLLGFLNDADLVVAPSPYGESFGVVLIEALASGTPVIAADNPGYAAVMTGPGAECLVPGGDAPALSRAIGRFAADPGLCRRIGQWGREHARQFDVDRLAPRLEAIYQEAFNRRRAVRTNCVSETT